MFQMKKSLTTQKHRRKKDYIWLMQRQGDFFTTALHRIRRKAHGSIWRGAGCPVRPSPGSELGLRRILGIV